MSHLYIGIAIVLMVLLLLNLKCVIAAISGVCANCGRKLEEYYEPGMGSYDGVTVKYCPECDKDKIAGVV